MATVAPSELCFLGARRLAGQARLAEAMPLWRAADDELRRTVGSETTLALSGLAAANLGTERRTFNLFPSPFAFRPRGKSIGS